MNAELEHKLDLMIDELRGLRADLREAYPWLAKAAQDKAIREEAAAHQKDIADSASRAAARRFG